MDRRIYTGTPPKFVRALLFALMLAGCDDEPTFVVSGSVTGTVPEDVEVGIVWVGDDNDDYSGDYLYRYGKGSVTDGTWRVTLPDGRLPADARVGEFGLGQVMLFQQGNSPPEGRFERFEDHGIYGGAPRHMVVWRDNAEPGWDWLDDFSVGYECGECVDRPEPENDSYAPTGCGDVTVSTEADVWDRWCQWSN